MGSGQWVDPVSVIFWTAKPVAVPARAVSVHWKTARRRTMPVRSSSRRTSSIRVAAGLHANREHSTWAWPATICRRSSAYAASASGGGGQRERRP